MQVFKLSLSVVSLMAATISTASASAPMGIRMGDPLSGALSTVMGNSVPFAESGFLGLVAAGVIGGVWLARRKR